MSADESKKFCGDDYYPVAFRVRMTGIVVLDSSYLSEPEGSQHIEHSEAVRLMSGNDSLVAEYIPLIDAPTIAAISSEFWGRDK